MGRLLFKIGGWQIEGRLPDVPKLVVAGGPHTSSWDAILAIAFLLATGLDFRWMAKKEAFAHPLGGFMRWLGGVPVDRQAPKDLVQQMIDEMNRNEKFVLVITPEGTRKKVERWKTGFYRIALGAGVPIAIAYADFPRRVIGIGPVIQPSGDVDGQIAEMRAFLRTITPRHPERA